ncbi:hypothetical protein ACFXDJ_03550 [Streptomyces sp. NPDC059443]|uniref:hypothetical protein n=1 Tax=unclassified Streptomyces TaxID=2593676 RepID=UPI0036B0FB1C
MFSSLPRSVRRGAAALIVTTAVAGGSLAAAAPASAAYGGGYGDAWVKGYGPDYGQRWVDNYGGRYPDNWTDAYDKNHGAPWGGGVPVAPVAKADVRITATGPAYLDHDEEQLWTVEITNTGKAAAQNVRSSTTMPGGIEYRAHRIQQGSASEELTSDGRIVLTIGTLMPGETVRLQIAGNAPSYGGGTVQLTSTVNTTSPESDTTNNTATVHTRIA